MAGDRSVEFILRARDEASDKLKKLKATLGEVAQTSDDFADGLAQSDERFRQLRGAAGALAQDFGKLREALVKVSQAARQQASLDRLNSELADQKRLVNEAAAAQQKAAASLSQANANYDRQAAAVRALTQEQSELLARQKELTAAGRVAGEFERITAAIEKLSAEQANAKRRAEELRDTLKQLEGNRAEAKAANVSTVDINKQIRSARAELEALEKRLNNAGPSGFEKSLERLNNELLDLDEKARKSGVSTADLVKSFDTLQREAQQVEARINALNPDVKTAEASLRILGQSSKEAAADFRGASADLDRARGALDRIAEKVNKAEASLNPLQQELREAGVDTRNLANEQNRLQKEVEQTAGASKQAAAAVRAYTAAKQQETVAERNGVAMKRTALSLYQRIRGQILSLTSAYVGVYGAINQVSEAFRVGSEVRGIEVSLQAINGNDLAKANEELDYTRWLADAVGQEYIALAKSYAGFRASVADKLPLEQQRFLFESIAKAAAVLNLSVDDAEGTFRAISQTFSKGKVTAEELRQQLGDRLPGAVRLLAEGLKRPEDELNKLLETGSLTAENLLFLAREANNEFGDGLAKALESPRAQFNILTNTVTRLREEFFKTAEAAGLGEALQKINEALKDPQVVDFVQRLARGFVGLLEVIPSVIRNFETLIYTLGIFLGFGAARGAASVITSLIAGFRGAAVVIAQVGPAITLVRSAFLALSAAIVARAPVIGTAFSTMLGPIGLLIAAFITLKALVENNGPFRRFVVISVSAFDELRVKGSALFERLVAAVRLGSRGLYAAIEEQLLQVKKLWADVFESILTSFVSWATSIADALPPEIGGRLAERLRAIRIGLADGINEEIAANQKEQADIAREGLAERDRIAKEEAAQLQQIAEVRQAVIEEALAEETKALKDAEAARKQYSFAPDTAGVPDLPPVVDKGEQRMQASLDDLLNEVRNKMNDITATVARGAVVTLDSQFRAIEQSYAKLLEDIQTLQDAGRLTAEQADAYRRTIQQNISLDQMGATKENIRQQLNSVEQLFALRDEEILRRQNEGDITSYDAEQEREALRAQMYQERWTVALTAVGAAQDDLAAARATNDEAAIAAAELQFAQAQQYADTVARSTEDLREKLITADGVNAKLADGLTETAAALAEVAANGGSLSDAFDAAGEAFRAFAANFLREIANMILRAAIFRALSGGALGGGIAGLVNSTAGVNHSGGVIGNGSADRTRDVSPLWFANARRFHSGGLPGLKADEVPAILQKGEEVLSKGDPRNVLNGGAQAQQAPRAQDIRIINTIDPASVLSEALATPEGVKTLVNAFRANKQTMKSALV
jgi:tape measure domain-containing protein